jgi:predicted RNA-binding Zn ribbon-like protein
MDIGTSLSNKTKSAVDDFRFDAGSLSLNFIATVGRRFGTPIERLESGARFKQWVTTSGLSADLTVGEAELERVRRFREDLNELFRAVFEAVRPSAHVLEVVNRVATSAAPRFRRIGDGVTLALVGSDKSMIDAILNLIATDAIRVLATSERERLHACSASDCQMLFLQHEQRPRQWCSPDRCGNRSRVAAHRARAAKDLLKSRG